MVGIKQTMFCVFVLKSVRCSQKTKEKSFLGGKGAGRREPESWFLNFFWRRYNGGG